MVRPWLSQRAPSTEHKYGRTTARAAAGACKRKASYCTRPDNCYIQQRMLMLRPVGHLMFQLRILSQHYLNRELIRLVHVHLPLVASGKALAATPIPEAERPNGLIMVNRLRSRWDQRPTISRGAVGPPGQPQRVSGCGLATAPRSAQGAASSRRGTGVHHLPPGGATRGVPR